MNSSSALAVNSHRVRCRLLCSLGKGLIIVGKHFLVRASISVVLSLTTSIVVAAQTLDKPATAARTWRPLASRVFSAPLLAMSATRELSFHKLVKFELNCLRCSFGAGSDRRRASEARQWQPPAQR